jgi:ribosomal protein S18 acetylase RimI-like enzyme
MDMDPSLAGSTHPVVDVSRVSHAQWRATEQARVVGQADATTRPDGRVFISIDAWNDVAFDHLAVAMLTDLQGPLHTIVDESDSDLLARWKRHGLVPRRRELEFRVPTSHEAVRGALASPPAGITLVPFGMANELQLCELDRRIRREVDAASGWHTMPAEVMPRPDGRTVIIDPARYAIAERGSRYVGLLRMTGRPRQPRLGLLAVRSEEQRRGVGRILLAFALHSLREHGVDAATTEVDQTNEIAVRLLEGFGAQHTGTARELERGR